jgi:hypothetical protein
MVEGHTIAGERPKGDTSSYGGAAFGQTNQIPA